MWLQGFKIRSLSPLSAGNKVIPQFPGKQWAFHYSLYSLSSGNLTSSLRGGRSHGWLVYSSQKLQLVAQSGDKGSLRASLFPLVRNTPSSSQVWF